jgi:hypothetical protein
MGTGARAQHFPWSHRMRGLRTTHLELTPR